ncbi:proteasome endopeptidase complex, beta component Threonine peptidase. MEROPS family T01A [Halobiforma haloterrestris]|uniref:Proteasome endopeptidase complex, beta component Threonine peptidase. MEROPS family T01A n=1 Tax=Natronobacterium haloterrestre TaxID=148448 RepID=A0A1I1IT13_NATHA|nr:proteasome subunit beta [Halobiforma haloterrestris]SFC36360.1 proteasome endopeptidase complex, beta component Threonine peptidase. MEROPS family T01A [Halobiforma haloterrestris]
MDPTEFRSRPESDRSAEKRLATDGAGSGDEGGGTLVALASRDGVLMAADTRVSDGTVVTGERARKLEKVHPTAAMGSADGLGSVRSIVRAVRSAADRYESERGRPMTMPALGNAAAAEIRSESDAGAFVLGGVDDDGPQVFHLHPDGGVFEEDHVAIGSGREVAAGVLEAETTDSLAMTEAREIVARALESGAERDTGTGFGVYVAEITAEGVDLKERESIAELR